MAAASNNTTCYSTSSGFYYERVHRLMVERVPELQSTFTPTPMAYDRWRRPNETLDNGQLCFLPVDDNTSKEPPQKLDYIYVAKPSSVNRKEDALRPGYYHLRTAEAHKEVYRRFCAQPQPARTRRRQQQRQRGRRQGHNSSKMDESIHTVITSPDDEDVSTKTNTNNKTALDQVRGISNTSNLEEDVKNLKDVHYYYQEAKRILYNRTWTEEPDDMLAQRMALFHTQSHGSVVTKFAQSARMPVLVSSLLLSLGVSGN